MSGSRDHNHPFICNYTKQEIQNENQNDTAYLYQNTNKPQPQPQQKTGDGKGEHGVVKPKIKSKRQINYL